MTEIDKFFDKSKKDSAREFLLAQSICSNNNVRYVKEQQEFIEYKSGYWQYMHREDVKALVISELMGQKFNRVMIENIIYFMQNIVPLNQDLLNQSNMINLNNGILCLDTLEFRDHSPAIMSTLRVDYDYAPTTLWDEWISIISEICQQDINKVNLLQEFFGYCLTKDTSQHKALFLFGPSRTGKSVILESLRLLVGTENCCSLEMENFIKPSNRGMLRNKLVNICTEINSKQTMTDSIFKALVSGEPIMVDPKNKDAYEFRPYCKLVFATNVELTILDRSDAVYKRMLVMDLERIFQEHEQDKQIIDKIKCMRPQILNWAISGLKRLKSRGFFTNTEQMQTRIHNMKVENSSILAFVEDVCTIKQGSGYISSNALYSKYRGWCAGNGYKPFAKNSFSRQIMNYFQSHGLEHKRTKEERGFDNITVSLF